MRVRRAARLIRRPLPPPTDPDPDVQGAPRRALQEGNRVGEERERRRVEPASECDGALHVSSDAGLLVKQEVSVLDRACALRLRCTFTEYV